MSIYFGVSEVDCTQRRVAVRGHSFSTYTKLTFEKLSEKHCEKLTFLTPDAHTYVESTRRPRLHKGIKQT